MADAFESHASGLDSPASNAAAVTPDDTTPLANTPRALWVGTAGNLSVIMNGGQTVSFANITAGWHPIRCTHVRSTGTTADNIVAVW